MNQLKWLCAVAIGALCPSIAAADLLVGEDSNTLGSGVVQRFDESGNLIPSFTTSNLYESLQDVTVGPDGSAFSLQNSLGGAIVSKLDPNTGAMLNAWGIQDANGVMAQEPQSATFGPDGFLYIGSTAFTSAGATNVFRVNPSTGAATQYMKISGPIVPSWILSLCFGPDNNLYFVDNPGGPFNYSAGAQILEYNPVAKKFFTVISASTDEASIFGGIAFSPSGDLTVDSTSGISEYTTSGTFLQTLVPEGSGGLTGAGDIAFGPDGDLYAISPSNQEILRYNATTGQFLGTYISAAQLGNSTPIAIAFVPEPATLLPLLAAVALSRRRSRISA